MNKPVFIYALHRSGSTYLKNIIASSSEIAMLEDEVHFDHPFFLNTFKKYFDRVCKNDFNRYDAFLAFLRNKKIRGAFWQNYKQRYKDFSRSRKYLLDSSHVTVWDSFNSILRQILVDSQKKRVGIKYPAHFMYFNDFLEQYPNSKNIFLIREPKAIIASKIVSPTNNRLRKSGFIKYEILRLITVSYFSCEYKYFLKTILKNKTNGLAVRYEDLVLEKDTTLKRICIYAEIQINEKMFDATGKKSGYSKALKNEDRVKRWSNILRKYEISIIDKITRKYKILFGYD